jgi:hypothetical protein
MHGQTLEDSRSRFSGVHSEKIYGSVANSPIYVLQLVAFRSAQDTQPYKVVGEQRFTDWDQYHRAYNQTLIMLEQAMAIGR